MKKQHIFKEEIESFGEILDTLTILNRENVLIFNNELLVFVLEDEISKEYFEKIKNIKKTVSMQYFIFNKDGVLVNETVDLLADVRNKNGKHLGYILRLPYIESKIEIDVLDQLIFEDSKCSKAILFWDDQQKGFICNNINNEIIKDSCLDIQSDLIVQGEDGGYILEMNGKTYSFSRLMLDDLDGNTHSNICNIGQFSER